MTNRKSQNSILFLTTLGVYLGLVLVGATPQVLAQARTNPAHPDGQFACKNNGLIWDETEESVDPFKYNLAVRIFQLIKDTRLRLEYVKTAESRPNSDDFFFTQIQFAPYLNRRNLLIDDDWTDASSTWSSAAQAGQIAELQSNFLQPLSDCSRPTHVKGILNSVDFRINQDGLTAKLLIKKASPARASLLVDSLNTLFRSEEEPSGGRALNVILSHTRVSADNDQVLVVTRLPRGSLDSLLATDAK